MIVLGYFWFTTKDHIGIFMNGHAQRFGVRSYNGKMATLPGDLITSDILVPTSATRMSQQGCSHFVYFDVISLLRPSHLISSLFCGCGSFRPSLYLYLCNISIFPLFLKCIWTKLFVWQRQKSQKKSKINRDILPKQKSFSKTFDNLTWNFLFPKSLSFWGRWNHLWVRLVGFSTV